MKPHTSGGGSRRDKPCGAGAFAQCHLVFLRGSGFSEGEA
jgi:hypothetical protein